MRMHRFITSPPKRECNKQAFTPLTLYYGTYDGLLQLTNEPPNNDTVYSIRNILAHSAVKIQLKERLSASGSAKLVEKCLLVVLGPFRKRHGLSTTKLTKEFKDIHPDASLYCTAILISELLICSNSALRKLLDKGFISHNGIDVPKSEKEQVIHASLHSISKA